MDSKSHSGVSFALRTTTPFKKGSLGACGGPRERCQSVSGIRGSALDVLPLEKGLRGGRGGRFGSEETGGMQPSASVTFGGGRKDSPPGAPLSSRPGTDHVGFGALARRGDFLFFRLSDTHPQGHAASTEACVASGCSDASLSESGCRPPYPGGREVPQPEGSQW